MTSENDNRSGSQMSSISTDPAEARGVEKPRKPRGFAAMDPKLVSELAKRGGKAAHRAGTADSPPRPGHDRDLPGKWFAHGAAA